MEEKPVIVAVDDETDELSTMRDALTRRFATDYRIASHLSARAALDEYARSRRKGERLRSSSQTSGCLR